MPEQVFFPYSYLEDALDLKISRVALDGQPVDIERIVLEDNRAVDLSNQGEWQRVDFSVALSLEAAELSDVLEENEDLRQVDALVCSFCGYTRERKGFHCSYDQNSGAWHGAMRFQRRDSWGFHELRAFLVRNVDANPPTSHLPTRIGERLAESATWHIYVDEKSVLPGGDIDIEWKKFSEIDHLKTSGDCLYYVDLHDDEHPRVLLNEDVADLKPTLMNPQRTGTGARIRDGLIHSILQQVLTELVLFATRTGPADVDELSNWRKAILQTLAGQMYPGCTVDDALERAYSTARDDDNLAQFLSQLSLAVQKHIDLNRSSRFLIGMVDEVVTLAKNQMCFGQSNRQHFICI